MTAGLGASYARARSQNRDRLSTWPSTPRPEERGFAAPDGRRSGLHRAAGFATRRRLLYAVPDPNRSIRSILGGAAARRVGARTDGHSPPQESSRRLHSPARSSQPLGNCRTASAGATLVAVDPGTPARPGKTRRRGRCRSLRTACNSAGWRQPAGNSSTWVRCLACLSLFDRLPGLARLGH